MSVEVTPESTPNPSTMKFQINEVIAEESISYEEASQAGSSPLALKLFGFPWTDSVYIGKDFVSLTKQDWVSWDILVSPLCGLIKEHIESKEPVVLNYSSNNQFDENDSPEVKIIKEVIQKEIRPQVALDGGDIAFDRYENHKVYIHMQGACSGCPSSAITLKQGIETRLKQALPEIEEVISL